MTRSNVLTEQRQLHPSSLRSCIPGTRSGSLGPEDRNSDAKWSYQAASHRREKKLRRRFNLTRFSNKPPMSISDTTKASAGTSKEVSEEAANRATKLNDNPKVGRQIQIDSANAASSSPRIASIFFLLHWNAVHFSTFQRLNSTANSHSLFSEAALNVVGR